jgi:heat shock protein HtpX
MSGNSVKTVLLLVFLSSLFLIMGRAFGGSRGVVVAFIIAMIMNAITYFMADKIVLSMYGAKPLDRSQFEHIYQMVEELAHNAHIPMPKLWYIPTSMANAFATGRNPQHASVAVTQGILDALEPHELRGVLAHELAHVKNRDILIGTIAATMAMGIGYLADMLQWAFIFGSSRDSDDRSSGFGGIIVAIIMPIAAMLIQMAISRSREYLADESGAKYSQDPLALASALEKLHSSSVHEKREPESQAQTATASLFIVYPFSGKGLINLFSTHPPMEKRIERLKKMAMKY